MSYQVGVDLGTAWTAAAVCRAGGTVEVVPLGERSPAVPSAVLVGADGVFVIGEAAERRALSDPARVVREFTRRIGDRTPVVVDGVPMAPETLAARFVARVLRHVAEREGGAAAGVAVTHPVGWGPHKLASLRSALADEGLPAALLVPEPQAAAIGYANRSRLDPGAVLAVYDLGGATFDAAVVGPGFELLGHPDGLERLGGADFDEVVFEHVKARLGTGWGGLDPSDPEVLAAVAALRRDCTAAKEALSYDTEVTIPVALPGIPHTLVRLGRAEFEEMIRPALDGTLAALRRAIASADLAADVTPTVLLVGGSSRIPLVGRLVAEATGRPAAVDVDPKGVIAAGAALAAHRAGAHRAAAAAAVPGPDPTPDAAAALPPAPVPSGPLRPGPLPADPLPAGPLPSGPLPSGPPPSGPLPSGRPSPAPAPAVPVPIRGVRPFREPRVASRPRPTSAIGIGLAVVATLVVGGSILAGFHNTGPIAPVGPAAEASTPAATAPLAVVPTAAPAAPARKPDRERAPVPQADPPPARRTTAAPTTTSRTTVPAPTTVPPVTTTRAQAAEGATAEASTTPAAGTGG